MIVSSGELLCTVVYDILDYSRLLSGNVAVEIRRTNVQETLNAVVKTVEHKAHLQQISLETEFSPVLPRFVNTDSSRLQQILYNLLGNAIKFSDQGGCVKLVVDAVHLERSVLVLSPENTPADVDDASSIPSRCPFHRSATKLSRIDAHAKCHGSAPSPSDVSHHDTVLRFTVTDNGRGIDAKDFGRIFEPFSQASEDTERLYGGTGLGLAITAKLVERLGGSINVESELGKWSKFTVDVPCALIDPPDRRSLITSLKDTQILYVDYRNAQCNWHVVSNLDLPVERFDSCPAMFRWMQESREANPSRNEFHCCLVHEDLFVDSVYKKLSAVSLAALVTFGPRRDPISASSAHFCSLADLDPCALLQSLLDVRQKRLPSSDLGRSSSLHGTLQQIRVLIVEDNLINQKVLYKMLDRLGVKHVDIANHGQEAVDMTDKQHYDVIFMDLQMPIMCGDEACRIIRQRYRDLGTTRRRPTITFVSAHGYSTYETVARDAGADGFIAKPFTVKKLQDYLRTLEL